MIVGARPMVDEEMLVFGFLQVVPMVTCEGVRRWRTRVFRKEDDGGMASWLLVWVLWKTKIVFVIHNVFVNLVADGGSV
ncbi:uncharacterized protein HKW66_Vig0034380 [Vigna angularis]|uniref:Uncharacterized protein n=1 Tax=Phaseolus angularis TaxID=3914 RepID=A0A8T0L9E2_PHAAN|nr:uncharacterized protein HKW66_Vig0034380 [Vigna angularis]